MSTRGRINNEFTRRSMFRLLAAVPIAAITPTPSPAAFAGIDGGGLDEVLTVAAGPNGWFLETRRLQADEIARVFCVPARLLGGDA
jgi:hypothetical protein